MMIFQNWSFHIRLWQLLNADRLVTSISTYTGVTVPLLGSGVAESGLCLLLLYLTPFANLLCQKLR